MKTALILVALLTGCSQLPGVHITDEERKVCEIQANCTVWTPQELQGLARHFMNEGYKAGRKSL